MNKTKKELIHAMLVENTGGSILDSGGDNGRNWQRNKGKTLDDFKKEKIITFEPITETQTSEDIDYTISTFHYLNQLDLDSICEKYNALKCKDWDSEIYGVSKEQEKWLLEKGFRVLNSFNTYNEDSHLSQVLQGTFISSDGTDTADYVLLQVHGGADVRGGYTDAKMFKLEDGWPRSFVSGYIEDVYVSNAYNGDSLTDEDGEAVPVTPQSVITLSLS